MNRSSVSQVAWPMILTLLVSTATLISSANGVPTSAEKLDVAELRYRVLERFGDAFFCDPDVFPIGLSPALARKRGLEIFPEIEKDQETFRAIAHHLDLSKTATLSDEQKLLVYREFNKLRGAVYLKRSDGQFRFKVGLKQKTGDLSIEGFLSQSGTITILKRERTVLICPKCLAAGTRIDTPNGWIPVQSMDTRQKGT